MRNITVAEAQGFCWGVERALDIVDQYDQVSILGDLIHNKQVVADLEKNNKKIVHEITGHENHPIVITAHGTRIENFEKIASFNLEVVDTTCPLVSVIYNAGAKLESEGYRILIIGDKNHIEVQGIASRLMDPIIVNNQEEVISKDLPEKIGVVSQSTFSPEKFDKIVDAIQQKVEDVRVRNTICSPTKKRQISAEKLAKKVDIMIVIGGYHSSNTKKLAELTSKYVETHHIETEEQLVPDWFISKKEIGITAGASTADWIIEKVRGKIKSFG